MLDLAKAKGKAPIKKKQLDEEIQLELSLQSVEK